LTAFAHGRPDRVPVHHIGFSSAAASVVLGREAHVGGGIQQWREACALWEGDDAHRDFLARSERDAFELAQATGQDILRLEYWRMPERPTQRLDPCTFLYGRESDRWCVRRFDPPTELYQMIAQGPGRDASAAATLDDIVRRVAAQEAALASGRPSAAPPPRLLDLMARYGATHAVRVAACGISIPYDAAWLEATVARSDLVTRHLDVQAERAIRSIAGLAAAGVRFVFGGGDLATNAGPFYSPRVFRELLLPRLQRVADACRQHGIHYLFGTDGDVRPIAEDLLGQSGVAGYYEIDRRAGMALDELRRRFPRLVLIGNISSHTLHRGTKEEVLRETRECLGSARSGGVIVGVSNYVLPGTPPENILAMLRAIEDER
jgi:hypothetical protein